MNSFGDRLAEERKRLGYNQTDFAEIGGVKRAAQVNYEGGRRNPDSNYLSRLAHIGLDVLYVLTGTPSASDLKKDAILHTTEQSSLKSISYANLEISQVSRKPFPTYLVEVGSDELKWLEWYRLIEEDDQDMVESIVQGFADRGKKKQSQTG